MSTSIEFRNTTPLTVKVFWLDDNNTEHEYARLQTFSSYTQQTYAGHQWVVRDDFSGQLIATTTAESTPGVFNIDIGNIRSAAAGSAVTIGFTNKTPLAVALFWIDGDGAEKPYANLRPGETVQQPTYAGHPWLVRSINGGQLIDLYLPSGQSVQAHNIELFSRESLTACTLELHNQSLLTLQLEWVDFTGKTVPYTQLKPGEKFTQSTFASHPWVLRDLHSGTIIDVIPAGFEPHTLQIKADRVYSLGGVKATQVLFQNSQPFHLDLFWVNYEGGEVKYATLEPGDRYRISSFATHPWRVRNRHTGELCGLFIAGADEQQQHEFSILPEQGYKAVSVTLANETSLGVSAYLLAADGKEYLLSALAPHERYTQTLFERAEVLVRDNYSGHLLRRLLISAEAVDVYVLSGLEVVSEPGTPAVNVNFKNQSPFSVEVFWVDFEGNEHRYATLKPGADYTQATGARHVWRVRELYSKRVVGLFVANDEAEQNTSFQVRSFHAHQPRGITFDNRSMLNVDVIWMDYDGQEKLYQTLKPGDSVGYSTFATHPWIVRDNHSRRLLDWDFGSQQKQAIVINDSDIKPREGVNAVSVQINNQLPFAVDVFWLDYQGREKRYKTLEPGEGYTQSTFETHPWRVRQQHSGEEIALYIPDGKPQQVFDVRLRSQHAETATSIRFVNQSPLKVGVYWLDYQGNEVRYAVLDSRESFTQQTFMSHPWIVRDMNSNEAVGFTVGIREPQVFNITGQATRSRKNTRPVKLQMKNATRHTVLVNWVDYEGNEVNYAEMAPNASFNVNTGEHHSWRIREKHSQTELDFYIANSHSSQQYSIQNKLVRTRERANAELWPGEVALYEHNDFKGRVWILHQDTPDFLLIDSLNDQVSSLRLGPDTAVTLFRHTQYQGTNDVFHLDINSLTGSDVGNDSISSLQILTTLPHQQSTIKSTSRLTEELRMQGGRNISYPVYRSIITVPPATGEIEVWATEETLIQADGKNYTIDPVKPARLRPNSAGKLIITIKPDALGTAALMLRTSNMLEKERFFVFPDVDVHTKILQLEPDKLWNQRNQLGLDSRFSRADVNQVQSALQSLSSTVPAASRSLSHGVSRDRFVVTDKMPYSSWALDFGGADRRGNAAFRPVSPDELALVNSRADVLDLHLAQGFFDFDWLEEGAKSIGKFVVETVPKTAVAVANETAGVVEDVGDVLEDAGEVVVNTARHVVKELGEGAEKVWDEASDWTEKAVEDTGKFLKKAVDDTGEFIVKTAEETAEFFEEVAEGVGEALSDAVEQVVRITVEVAGKFYQFVADSVETIGKFAQKVIEELGVAWNSFVDFIKDIFDWSDILTTHDYIIKSVNDGIDMAQDSLNFLKHELRIWLADLQGDVVKGIDGLIDQLGASDIAAQSRTGGIDTSEMSDKLDWLMSHIVGGDSGGSAAAGGGGGEPVKNPLMDSIMGLVPQSVKDQLEHLLTTFIDLIKEHIENDLPVVIDAFLDSLALFQTAMEQPSRAKELILSGVLSMLKSLLVVGFSAIDIVITMIFEFVLAAIELIQTGLNEPLNIPFLSGLYASITRGRDLTALSLFSLLMAVPATIAGKLILGRAPFQNVTVIGQSVETNEVNADGRLNLTAEERGLRELKRDWAIGYGVLHFILMVSDLVYDISGGAAKQTSPQGKQVTYGKQHRWSNRRGSIRFKEPDKTVVTPEVFGSVFNADPQSGIGKGMTVIKLFVIAAGVLAQVAGNPLGHHGGMNHEKLDAMRQKGPGHVDYWSYTTWCFQWSYLCIGALDFGVSALGSAKGTSSKAMDYALPALTTAVGIVHMGLMSKLVDIDRKDKGGYSAVTGRRHGGWMFDTLPAISKVLTYKEVNEGTYNIPLAIHSILFVGLGHLGEATVYWVRAGKEVDEPDFDL
ncbi:MAG: hypothetical protein R3F02_06835 [Thiolinea sp.]